MENILMVCIAKNETSPGTPYNWNISLFLEEYRSYNTRLQHNVLSILSLLTFLTYKYICTTI